MKIASLGIAVALGAAPLVAHAQVSVSGGISFNLGAVPGEAVPSVDVFYDQLSPYGVWVDDPVAGRVFIPDQAGYVPYRNGHWEYTDAGFVWISSEPFAWATSHYGRWWYSADYGRWVWIPDTVWGPSWVDWYESGDYFGWAPLAPDFLISAGFETPFFAFSFVPAVNILDVDIVNVIVPRDRVVVIEREARPIAERVTFRDRQVIAGPSLQRLQAHRVTATPRRVDVKAVGRLEPSQTRVVEQRARERLPQIERQNAKRLEANTQLRKTIETRAAKTPEAKPRPAELTRPQPKAAPTPQPKAAPTPQPKAAPTPQPKTAPMPQPKTAPMPQPKTAPTPEPNAAPTPRPEPRETTRPAPTAPTREERTPPQPEPKVAPPPQPEPKAEPTPRPEPKAEPTPRPEPKAAPTPRPEPKAAPTPRPEPKAAPTPRPEPKAAPTPRPEPQAAPTPRPEPKAAPTPRPEPQSTRPEPTPRAEPKGQPQGHGNDKNDKGKDQH